MLDDADLDEASKLEAREQLEARARPDAGEDEQRRRWSSFKTLGPTVWESSGAKTILATVVSAAVKTSLGL